MIRHADDRSINELLADTDRVMQAVRQAGRDARLRHKQLGVPLVVWRDGQVVEIPPEEIVVDPPTEKPLTPDS
ncbi:MAG TPA: hypothetical protein VFV87_22840 [Pirellulaceae bacterium]|nr:hypothetical protein [Pirellulaceae bacterium]